MLEPDQHIAGRLEAVQLPIPDHFLRNPVVELTHYIDLCLAIAQPVVQDTHFDECGVFTLTNNLYLLQTFWHGLIKFLAFILARLSFHFFLQYNSTRRHPELSLLLLDSLVELLAFADSSYFLIW